MGFSMLHHFGGTPMTIRKPPIHDRMFHFPPFGGRPPFDETVIFGQPISNRSPDLCRACEGQRVALDLLHDLRPQLRGRFLRGAARCG